MTMINVGWVDGPYSPIEVLESLANLSPQQAPLYYWLLNLWGAVVPQEIAFARLLSLHIWLLFLAVCFRLARDFVAPAVGLVALAIIASNAFLNIYVPNARMYTLYLLAAAVALWFYLRIMHRASPPSRGDYVGFFLACLALAASIVASAFVFAAVGAYHVLLARKGARWRRVCLCVALALLMYSPWAFTQFSTGAPKYLSIEDSQTTSAIEILSAEVRLLFNGSPITLLATLGGLAVAWRRRHIPLPRYLLLIVFFLVVVALVEQTVGVFRISRMRYSAARHAVSDVGANGRHLRALSHPARISVCWRCCGSSPVSRIMSSGPATTGSWRRMTDPSAPPRRPFMNWDDTPAAATAKPTFTQSASRHQNLVAWRKGGYRLLDHYFDLDRVNFQTKKSLDGLGVNVAWNAVTSPSVWLWFSERQD